MITMLMLLITLVNCVWTGGIFEYLSYWEIDLLSITITVVE